MWFSGIATQLPAVPLPKSPKNKVLDEVLFGLFLLIQNPKETRSPRSPFPPFAELVEAEMEEGRDGG